MEPKSSKKEDSKINAERRDPFAIDLFGVGGKTETQRGLKSVKAKPLPDGVSRNWHESLELIPTGGIEGSFETPGYPAWIEVLVNEKLMPSMRALAPAAEDLVHFEIISFEDSTADVALERLRKAVNLFVRFEFGDVIGIVSLSTELAAAIIDGVLSGRGDDIGDLRPLSTIELAICEYVAGSAFSKLNSSVSGRARLRVLGVSNDLSEKEFGPGRVVEAVADVVAGQLSGMVSILLPFELANTLNKAFGSVVSEKTESGQPGAVLDFIGETGVYLNLGSTVIPAVEIPFLEPDDIVLISNPLETWWDRFPDPGKAECIVGASSNIRLRGRLSLSPEDGNAHIEVYEVDGAPASPGNSRIVEKGAIRVEKQDLEAKSETESEESEVTGHDTNGDTLDSAGLVALENVMVDLRVQVAGRKISLNDLGRIHAGQIIDLGCRPEDPVELIAESSDRPIAAGELVKIEDQLGVRVTKVFV